MNKTVMAIVDWAFFVCAILVAIQGIASHDSALTWAALAAAFAHQAAVNTRKLP